jgi:ribosomal protein S18 acetylase RimI-like enzyme
MITKPLHIAVYKKPPRLIYEQIQQLGYTCFATKKFDPIRQKRNQDQTTEDKPKKTIVVMERGKLLGRTKLFKRTSVFDDTRIVIGGIGGVCVEPNVRRQGIGSCMIHAAIRELKKDKADIALLIVDSKNRKLVSFYQKLGFTLLNKNCTYTGKSGKCYADKHAMIAPVGSRKIYAAISKTKLPFHIGSGSF